MALVDFSELHPEIRTIAPGCPRPTVDRLIRSTAIRLCEEAKCHRVDLDRVYLVAANAVVDLDAPAQMAVHEVITATIDGRPIEPTTAKLLNARNPRWADAPGTTAGYFLSGTNQLSLAPPPAVAGEWLMVNAAVKPTRDATQLDEYLLDNFFDAIVAGALSRILMLPNRDFTNPNLATAYGMAFTEAVQTATRHGQRCGSGKKVVVGYGGI